MDHPTNWRTSSYSGSNNDCVEVGDLAHGGRAVRDSKRPDDGFFSFHRGRVVRLHPGRQGWRVRPVAPQPQEPDQHADWSGSCCWPDPSDAPEILKVSYYPVGMSHPGPSAVEIRLSEAERAELVRRTELPHRRSAEKARIILA